MNVAERLVVLVKTLAKFFLDPAAIRRFFKGFIQHWGVRVSAFLIALGTWAYVQSTLTEQKRLTIPLKLVAGENFLARAFTTTTNSTPITEITIDATFSKKNSNIRDGDYEAVIDLNGETEANIIRSYAIDIKKDIEEKSPDDPDINYKQVKLSNPKPVALRIEIDEVRQREIPVIPVLEGSPKQGFEVVSTNVEPSVITVSGPARIIDPLEQLYTEKISIAGMSKMLESDYSVVAEDSNIKFPDQSKVTVRIGINTKPYEKEFHGITIKPLGTPADDMDVSFSPATVSVTLEAQQDIIDTVNSLEITAYVDIDNAPRGKDVLLVKIAEIPVKCMLVKVTPASVTNYIGIVTE
jgi:hypothetical protein